MFLYETRFQKQQFQPKAVRMKQRLLPSLLLLGRFFEMCHDFLEEQAQGETAGQRQGQEDSIAFQFQRHLMAGCSDELLVQTQDVALVLVTFLRQTMRPPSKYGSIERALRHGLTKPPSDKEIAAVLYHGGLEMITSILDLEAFDMKAAAVRAYCALPQPAVAAPKVPPLGRKAPCLGEPEGLSGGGSESTAIAIATEGRKPFDLSVLLPRLPGLDQIWRPAAEALLKERKVIGGRRDLNTYAVALKELIEQSETRADGLYRQGHALWHALSDGEKRLKANSSI